MCLTFSSKATTCCLLLLYIDGFKRDVNSKWLVLLGNVEQTQIFSQTKKYLRQLLVDVLFIFYSVLDATLIKHVFNPIKQC